MELLLPVLVFITVVLTVVAVGWRAEDTLYERLKVYGASRMTERQKELSQPFVTRVLSPLLRPVSHIADSLTPGQIRQRAESRLEQADYPLGLTVDGFLVLRLLFAVSLPSLFGLATLTKSSPPGLKELAMVLAAAWLGSRLPDMWLGFKIGARKRQIERSLPDAMDLLTVCVEAGYGLDAAMAKVSEKTRGPLSEEFRKTLQQVTLGRPRREALRDMARRAGVPDLGAFIAALVQADQMGVSIAQVLRVHSDQMRVRRRQRAEERAIQAPVKMLFPLIFLIFPAMLVVILSPAGIALSEIFADING